MVIEKEGEPRIEYLARVLVSFMHENAIAAECTVIYDEAECDGHCLAQDFIDELGLTDY